MEHLSVFVIHMTLEGELHVARLSKVTWTRLAFFIRSVVLTKCDGIRNMKIRPKKSLKIREARQQSGCLFFV